MMTGSAIAIPWEAEHIPAIVNAWYGGQSAGTAVADVLFGDYNPAGRLPVTFYKNDSDLPSFTDYSMHNRTYRYFKGQPLYGFGYGLSYTTFQYDQLKVTKGNQLTVTARLTNTGNRDGEEVVELYASIPGGAAPVRSLKGFQRLFLHKGESKTVQFVLSANDLSIADDGGNAIPVKGKVLLSLGGSQPDKSALATKKVVQSAVMF